jgi:hypothetical protein
VQIPLAAGVGFVLFGKPFENCQVLLVGIQRFRELALGLQHFADLSVTDR